jgi:cytochrome c556
MFKRYALLILASVMVAGAAGDAGVSAQSPALQAAMQQKLANAQSLLEAVVKADYPAVARYAEPLSRISEAEIALWQTPQEPEYAEQARLFLLAVRGLREEAGAGNIAAVSDHYTTLISTCIACHAYVRSVN